MAENSGTNGAGSMDLLFAVLTFLILVGTILVAIGGVYFSFINPSF